MTRRKLIAGNWKMHLGLQEAEALTTALCAESSASVDVLVAPVATAIATVARAAAGRLLVAGQNCHVEEKGAFTGEVSANLLRDAGATHVILGHSERRQFFGETDELIRRKASLCQKLDLIPIVCVGETLEQREAGVTLSVIRSQLEGSLVGVDLARLVVAYEPVWAIGTGKTALPSDAEAVHREIRGWARSSGESLRILYGGSMKADNAAELLAQPNIDGGLVGGASLVAEQFLKIIRAAASC